MKWELKYWLLVDNEELAMTKEVDEFSIVPLKTKVETLDDTITKNIEYRNKNGEKGAFSMRYVISIKPIAERTTAKERVEKELTELQNKRDKLFEFGSSGKIKSLPEIQQNLLGEQLITMEHYILILKDRLKYWQE